MVQIFLQGLLLGLIISLTIGPAFFAMIQTGISGGFRSGALLAFGIALSDIVLIVLCFLGTVAFLESTPNSHLNNLYLGIGGGAILIAFGAIYFTKKPDEFMRRNPKYSMKVKALNPYAQVGKGFVMNIANPFLVLFWIAAISRLVSWVNTHAPGEKLINYALMFFSGAIIVIFGMDLLKSFVGNRIKKYLTIRFLFWVNRVVGILFATFGISLILRSIWNFV
jgi:threonine/homoserine/homoserine lactone efflux protein